MPVLTSRPVKRVMRPVISAVDRRIARYTRAEVSRSTEAEITALREELRQTRKALDALGGSDYAIELLLGSTGRGTPRMPNRGQIKVLAQEIREVTGVQEAERQLHLAFRTLVVLESLGAGRIAGSTMNIVGKLSTTPLLKPPNDEVLEIGTLYGLFAAGLSRQLTGNGYSPSLTIVDPMAGLQLQPGHEATGDPSGTPVAEHVVRANLRLSGLPEDRLRLRRGFSNDPEVQAAVSDREYGVVIVDGDHSEEGVLRDLEWAEKITASGGIVVLDDYTDRKWPGVKNAVDKHLAGDTRFEYLGRTATSGYLRAR